jgi:sporulation protein YlmC with PRC-barrel domain
MKSVRSRLVAIALFGAAPLGSVAVNAQAQATPPSAQLIGASVFATDGVKVGEVADVSTARDGIDQLRVRTGSALGFGERIVAIPHPAFKIRGAKVILRNLTSQDVEAMPSVSTENNGPQSEER